MQRYKKSDAIKKLERSLNICGTNCFEKNGYASGHLKWIIWNAINIGC